MESRNDCRDYLNLESEPYLFTAVSEAHKTKMKDLYKKQISQEITVLEKELESLRLEKKWCFDEEGRRVIPSPEEQAMKICQQIENDPDLVKDVVKALRMKKLDLQMNIRQLKG